MWRVARRGIRRRPVRFALSCLSVLLGVAFVVGSLTLTSTIQRSFDDLFKDLAAGTDLTVRGSTDLKRQGRTFRPRIDASLYEVVRSVPGVDVAVPRTSGVAYLVGTDEKVVGGSGEAAPDPIATSWPDDPRVSPFRIAAGRAPRRSGEVVIDRRSARLARARVGSVVSVLTKGEPERFTVVGLARFGSAESPGGIPVLLFDLGTAQRLLGEPGKLTRVDVVVRAGADAGVVRAAIAARLPEGVQVITAADAVRERQEGARGQLQFFGAFLLLFAVLSVVVGGFLIANTFAITVAQRTRELALLRLLGAARVHVARVVLGEALLVGAVASAVGVAFGVLVAVAMRAGVSSLGVVVPDGPLVVSARTLLVGAGIGVVTTLASAVVPAWRASRVAPVEAMRDTEVEARTGWVRAVSGALLCGIGVGVLRRGASLPSLGQAGWGTLVLLFGIVVASPVLSVWVTWLLSAPLPFVRGVTGRLARRNAARSPRRTATTAMALTVGAAVSCFALVMGASFKESIRTAVAGGVRGDFVITGGAFGVGGLPPSLATRVAGLAEVEASSGVRYGFAAVTGPARRGRTRAVVRRVGARPIAAFDPAVADRLIDVRLRRGRLRDLGPGRIAVSTRELDEKGWNVGDTLTLRFASGTARVRVVASFELVLAFDYAVSIDTMAPLVADDFDYAVYVATRPGTEAAAARKVLEGAVRSVPLAKVRDQREFTAGLTDSVDQLFTLVSALMALAVAIAVLGIAITLTLTVHERTRELGLLRAVGMTRRQARAMVRAEAVVVALFAAVLGVAVGVAAAWGITRALRTEGLGLLRVPVAGVAVLGALSALAGVVAAVVPARRAARVDVLVAITQA